MNTAMLIEAYTFLGNFLCIFGSFVALGDFQELLEFGDFSRLNKEHLTIWWLKYNLNKYYNISNITTLRTKHITNKKIVTKIRIFSI